MVKKLITNYAIDADINTLKQFNDCINEDFVVSGSLMADAHSGYVAPIGAVLKTRDYIVPSWVGYDIGCGMICVKLFSKDKNKDILKLVKDNAKQIYCLIEKIIPMGLGEHNTIENITKNSRDEFEKLVEKFKIGKYDKNALNIISSKGIKNLGTLGSGNHFIELLGSENKDNFVWLVIHSGSRNIGHSLATMYMKKASKTKKGYEQTYPLKFDSIEGQEYLNVLDFCLDYALLNRLEIANKIHQILEQFFNLKIDFELWTNKNHNHAIKEGEYFIHRKGATPAKLLERGVIPGNMRDGCFLVEGLGNKEFLESSSHGAGRAMSRGEAKKNISLDDFKKSMIGIVGTVRENTIDEAPNAYKNINDVMNAQKTSVKIIKHLKPIINLKG